jgi:transposase-like protein
MLFIAKKVKNEASPEKELKFHCKDCGRTLANEGKNQANQNNIARKFKFRGRQEKTV